MVILIKIETTSLLNILSLKQLLDTQKNCIGNNDNISNNDNIGNSNNIGNNDKLRNCVWNNSTSRLLQNFLRVLQEYFK